MAGLARLLAGLADPDLQRRVATQRPIVGGIESAVLMLLSGGDDPDLLFTERAGTLRHHAGQLSFPGGRAEARDASSAATALRETWEEIGLGPDQIEVIGTLPARGLPVTRFDVAPVVGTWSGLGPVEPKDAAEVAAVWRYPISVLADPAHRVSATLPGRGNVGPGWILGEEFLWGFSAYLTDGLLRRGGWARPWDAGRLVEVPIRFRGASS